MKKTTALLAALLLASAGLTAVQAHAAETGKEEQAITRVGTRPSGVGSHTTFTGNVNNFNVIYLLTNGDPTPVGASAGKTDLLITWLYKLTVDKQNYSLGAVIGIMTFIVLAVVSLITYRNSGSYKNEEGFQ